MDKKEQISSSSFYWNYHGHRITDLEALYRRLRQMGCSSLVWLAGDSSMDNKHWFFDDVGKSNPDVMYDDDIAAPAVNGYEKLLEPPRMIKDVCYWLNNGIAQCRPGDGPPAICCINTAVEESTLGERLEDPANSRGEHGGPTALAFPQDTFIRDHIGENDVLVVNLGGNDIALRPSKWTIAYMAALVYLSATPIIRYLSWAWNPFSGCYIGFPIGLSYFVDMFKQKTKEYLEQLVVKQKPKRIVVCMLYHLDQQPGGSWADQVLGMLGYDTNPAKLQAVIKRVFELGTSQIQIEGTEVVACPLFRALDGTDTGDYIQRVEPSSQGGQKMASLLLPHVLMTG